MSEADRIERYRRRLDAHLATLPDDLARRRFCDREFARWERLYGDWLGNPSLMPVGATAFDFSITLADISLRQIKYGGALVNA